MTSSFSQTSVVYTPIPYAHTGEEKSTSGLSRTERRVRPQERRKSLTVSPLLKYPDFPVRVQCPHCSQFVTTTVRYRNGTCTYALATALLLTTVILFWVPFCLKATKGGIVLWSKTFARVRTSPVDPLIKEVLIEERAGETEYVKDSYCLKWTFANELDLIFVVAYQKILQLAYIDELLSTVKKYFCEKFAALIRDTSKIHNFEFDSDFDTIRTRLERKGEQEKRQAPRKFDQTKKYKSTLDAAKTGNDVSDLRNPQESVSENQDAFPANKDILSRGGKARTTGKKKKGNKQQSTEVNSVDQSQTRKKVMRKWDDKVSKEEAESLDYSNSKNSELDSTEVIRNFVDERKLGRHFKDGHYENKNGGIFSFFKSITGQKELTERDLAPVMANMREHLIKKNVAADIASHLCDSITKNLVGQKLGSFRSVHSAVKLSMEASLTKILTPKTSVDLLRDIAQAQSESRPYTICFIGVNGVGDYLNMNNLRVLIAACDTFRSGAVEQLRVHVRNLNMLGQGKGVELYERGYGKDAAGIAKDAISYAKTNRFDVVLIDTAGRMQDNEPLMRALAKLVTVNDPDKIIFVGEALVGNEAVDQLTKFNQALKDFSGLQNPRQIDGIILTKFDTIDDKVGAALSMTYTTGQPILFVGTGQTYTDLKNMKIGHVVQSLIKG
ncbi:8695_t:CDS:10 [Paraglomus occultum]|uniref:8695_t:CDS:1 n=1 Tax=Paraglomus occultum TaxID=144539 RepID=A0A9N9AJ97_9GLOM|nr:8695_t:CDS:10 [Paraglomus occultum]